MSILDAEQLENAYIVVYQNAIDLLEEAKILYNNQRYARAYFLAQISFEEIGKLPIILHETTRATFKEEHDWKKFYRRLRSHNAKNEMNVIFNAFLEKPNLDWDFKEIKDEVKRLNILKNASLYSDLDGSKFVKPSSVVSKDSAYSRIQVAESHLEVMTLTDLHKPGTIIKLLNTDIAKINRKIMKEFGLI